MSGIVGIYHLDSRPIEPANLQQMVNILAHRGPDGADTWCDRGIGLGHRMLWTTPESLHEQLPSVKGQLAITADARIDNREELASALNLKAYLSEKISDSELILAAYQKWGDRCSERLLGDFAFAIWDGRAQTLFCARDHFGIKPFYYYHQPGAIFAFASEIKALWVLKNVPASPNSTQIARYLEADLTNETATFFQDILRLPPAHSMIVSATTVTLQRYWSLDPTYELRLGSDAEYAEAFREVFTEAVRCRLRSAFPVGSTLSGGLDSSAIACVARDLLHLANKPSLPTFSIIFDQVSESDERAFQNAVIAQGGVVPHYVYGDRISPLGHIDRMLWHQDQPFYCPNLFLNWGVFEAAQSKGVRVLLDGFDGDTAVSHGLGYLDELAQAKQWLTLAKEAKGLARNSQRSAWQIFWRYVRQHNLDPVIAQLPLLQQLRKRKQQWDRAPVASTSWNPTINAEFMAKISLQQSSITPQTERAQKIWTERERHYRMFTRGQLSFVQGVLDHAVAAFPLEARYPFNDRRLVEFCLSLPPEQKMHQGWTRMILRRGMDGILPKEIQWRGSKANLSYSFEYGLREFDQVQLQAALDANESYLAPYLDVARLKQTYQHWMSQSAQIDNESTVIWIAVTLALWLRQIQLTQ